MSIQEAVFTERIDEPAAGRSGGLCAFDDNGKAIPQYTCERIFDIEDEMVEKRARLVEALEKRMEQKTTATPLFTIRWRVE